MNFNNYTTKAQGKLSNCPQENRTSIWAQIK